MSFIKKPIVILGGIIVLLLLIGVVTGSNEKKAEGGTVLPSPAPAEVKAETVQASVEPIVSSLPSPSSTTAPPIASPTPAKSSQTPSTKASIKTETTQNPSGACKYSCTSPDRDCKDFSRQAEAQAFFDCCGFSASNDPMRLDKPTGVGNGKACESLP